MRQAPSENQAHAIVRPNSLSVPGTLGLSATGGTNGFRLWFVVTIILGYIFIEFVMVENVGHICRWNFDDISVIPEI